MQDFKQSLFTLVDKFIENSSDTNVGRENANFIRCLPVLEHLLLGKVCEEYMFEHIYKPKGLEEIKSMHDEGFIYHHQASKLSPYCVGLSSYDLAVKGLCSNATNERASSPPKRIDTLLSQAANLICLLAQEVSGATSLNDLSTVLAGYLYHLEKDGLFIDSEYISNAWQSFIYNMNLPFRAGNSPFSNITLDFSKSAPQLRDKIVSYAGGYLDYTYGSIPSEYFDRINYAFIQAMTRGDHLGNPFTFPLITVNITDDFDYDNPCWNYFLERSENFGGFYLQNYCSKPFNDETRKVNPYHTAYPIDLMYSNCCRMTFPIDELIKLQGSNPFASGSGIGGINVIAINLNRVMWLTQGKSELLYPLLDQLISISGDALEVKRSWIREHWLSMYPYLSNYVKDDKSLFSIISVLGMHEGLKSMGYEKGIYDNDGKKLAHTVALYIHDKVQDQTQKHGNAFTLEFAPSESAACKLAEKDLIFATKLLSGTKEGDMPTYGTSTSFETLISKCIQENFNLMYRTVQE